MMLAINANKQHEPFPSGIKFLFAADWFSDIILVLKYKWLSRIPGPGFNRHQI
jgi:hypothetical protein